MFSLSVPKWVVAAVAAAALVFMAVGYAISAPAPHSLRTFATEAGLPTDFELRFETVESDKDFNAYFTTGGMWCFFFLCGEIPPHILVAAPATWPREWVLAALYHEIGHYEQWREGVPRTEWDADLRALKSLCARGLNGPEILAGVYAHVTPYVKIESPRHGNHYRRIDNMRGRGCSGRGLDTTQSP